MHLPGFTRRCALDKAGDAGVIQHKNISKSVFCNLVRKTIAKKFIIITGTLIGDLKPDIFFVY
jgi:hypothetical protein